MENKEHLAPDAGKPSRKPEERQDPQETKGSSLIDKAENETSDTVEAAENSNPGTQPVAEPPAVQETDGDKPEKEATEDPSAGEPAKPKKKTPARKSVPKTPKDEASVTEAGATATEAPVPAPEALVTEAGATATEAPVPAPEAETTPEEVTAEGNASDVSIEEPDTPVSGQPDKPQETGLKAEKEDPEDKEEDLAERYADLSREELVGIAEALIKEEDVNYIRKHIGFVKAAYRKLVKEESLADFEKRLQDEGEQDGPGSGDQPESADQPESSGQPEVSALLPPDPLTERFDRAFATYREKKALYDQALEQQKQENLAVKEGILEDLRNLIESEEELKKTYDMFRDLQEKWRNVGAVPQNAKGTLWNNYHFLVEKFFDKVKINKELKDLDLKKNLESKTELCEKAEELLLEPSITKSFQRLQKLHEAWKETGPVPKDKKDEIWDRFKAATDKLNKRRQEYYDILRDEQNNNYAAKLVLCEKAELVAATSPASPKQWQQQTHEINEIFKMWKTIGFAPKKVNNEVWNRFRSSLDTFYRNKKEFFKKYKEVQTENYNQKLNLCMQAEALKENEDWKSTTEELITLQKEWKKIGPVPAKFSDKIWKRFRAACDEFFQNKSEHFSNIGEKQEENLKKKLELIEQVKNHTYSDDNVKNLDILKDFQRKWMEIGHVPIKHKDKVQNEFRKAVDQQFEQLNISKKAKNTLGFRTRVESIKSSPQSDNILYRERNFLANKIHAIQSDIKIWENNIGFFASSKKADILKAEFEEKIEKGKQEIALLEEKLKILRES